MSGKFFNLQRFAQVVTLSSGIDEYSNSDSDKIIYALGGDDKIFNVSDKVTVNGDAGNDLIINGQYFSRGGATVNLSGGTGNDTITNSGSYSKIDGGDGADLIHNGYYYYEPWNAYYENSGYDGEYDDAKKSSYTTIYGGAGNDSIYNLADNVTIDAGTGNNYAYSNGSNVLVKVDGGKNTVGGNKVIISGTSKNETLSGDKYSQTFQYQNGGGNDVITNYSGEDIVHITSGKIDTYSFDGGDLIFKVGDGSLRLKNMKNHAITVKDSSGKTSTKIYGGGYSGQEVIKNFIASLKRTELTGTLAMDEAVKSCSHFNGFKDAIDNLIKDCRNTEDSVKFLEKYCGIILDNIDTGAASGWDAGGLKMTTGESENFDDNTMTILMPMDDKAAYPKGTSFSYGGLTLNIPKKNTLTQQEQYVVRGLYSWWLKDAVDFLYTSYGLNFKEDAPYFNTVNLYFADDSNNGAWGWVSGNNLTVNMAHTHFENETDYGGNGVAWMLIHEFTHVFQFAHFKWWPNQNYIIEGMGSLTAGWDADAVKALAGSSDSLKSALSIDNPIGDAYSAGFIFLRYLMKQASDAYDRLGSYAWKSNSVITGTAKADLLTSGGNYITLSGGAGKDTLTAYGKKSKIYGGDGNDNILAGSTAKNLTISGGAGKDTVNNKGTSIKIYGGNGNDSINNEGAKAKIYGGAGNDTVDNKNANVKIYGDAGNDKIYNYGDKSTLKGDAGSDFIINGQYWESERGGQKVVIDGGESADTITSHGKNSVLKGGSGNDLIYNGYRYYEPWDAFYDYDNENYDGSNSKIYGGKGSDTVNNKGANTKIYGGKNNDKIYNYGDKSTLKGEAGNDFIINGQYFEGERGGQKVLIDGGAGVDTIIGHGNGSVLKGGSGNDLIYNGYRYYEPWNAFYDPDDTGYNGSNSTIVGGKGNDKISLSSSAANNVIRYASGDGNDTVVGFGADDTLKITKGTYKTSVSGSDVVVKVGKGSVTLKDAVGKKISITNSSGQTSSKTYSSTSALFAENNFVAADNLSSIVENNLPPMPGKIEMPTLEKLTEEKILITCAEK